jgi:acyl-CoA hydrolase
MKFKNPKDSFTIQTHLVMPNDANQLGNLFGGQLMAWMDEVASISAFRHCDNVAVTASINNVSFTQPIPLGSYVIIEASVSRAFNTSMEIYLDVFLETRGNVRSKCNEAIFLFVAMDDDGKPFKVPELVPETELEQQRFEAALRRKQLSLVLSGRLKPENADELRKLFVPINQ